MDIMDSAKLDGKRHYITQEEYESFQEEYWEYRKQQHEEWGTEPGQENAPTSVAFQRQGNPKSQNEQLEQMKEAVAQEKDAFTHVTADFRLWSKGRVWDSARSYISATQIPLLQSTDIWLNY